MRRRVEAQLLAWKGSRRRKPLIVRGARQVGKTHSVQAFGRAEFEELALVDLERNLSAHNVFAGDLDPRRMLSELRVMLDKAILPGRSLLFLDEIQACPRALMALRYFFEELPELHVIAAGSLLEFALQEISVPVGRVQFMEMHPLTFAEYLRAVGRERAAEVVNGPPGEVPETVHQLLLGELRDYFFVGGMPESVRVYAETRSLRECLAIQRDLCDAYRQDFAKYAPRSDPMCLDAVLSGVARTVGQQVKYTRLAEEWSIPTIRKAFELLSRARVVHRVSATSPAGLPLAAGVSPKRFKALVVDVGLLQQLRGVRARVERAKGDLLAIHEGALAEQFVGQELRASLGTDLCYWSRRARNSTAEVDFLAAVEGAVVPIEVKSGAAGRLRSLHMLLEAYPSCPHGLVFSSRPYGELPEQRLRFLPLYQAASAVRSD